jgi:hypothetical protein
MLAQPTTELDAATAVLCKNFLRENIRAAASQSCALPLKSAHHTDVTRVNA